MLEDRLREDTRSQPVEASLELLDFVQNSLPRDGQLAAQRFLNLVQPLCNALFGRIGSESDSYRHLHGGWISEQEPWVRPAHVGGVPSIPHGPSKSSFRELEKDPVVKLLGTAGEKNQRFEPVAITLIEALSLQAEKYPGKYLEFPFLALPKPMQEAWLEIMDLYASPSTSPVDYICSENDIKLFLNYFRNKPSNQHGLRLYKTQEKSMVQTTRQHAPYPNNPGVFYTSPQSPNFVPMTEDLVKEVPKVHLSFLEYYLLSFLRYPLFLPDPKTATSKRFSTIPGVNIHHFPSQRIITPLKSAKPKYGEEVYLHVFQKYIVYFFQPCRNHESFPTQEESALFLSLVTALWFESTARLAPETKAQQDWKESHMRAKLAAPAETNLSSSHDLTMLHRHPFTLPSKLMLSGIRMLTLHLVMVAPSATSTWNIEPSMIKLQQSFYNFIRGCFRFMNVSSADNSAFQDVLNIWLIWLEPWNRRSHRGPSSPPNLISTIARNKTKKPFVVIDIPRHDQASKYEPSWEPYIASNLFIYLIPLAIFIRRARELDFTASGSFDTVSRVFRVFTPEVVTVLRRHCESTQGSRMGPVVEQHKTMLGPFCPTGNLHLSSLEGDLRKLFEDIDARHAKAGPQSMPFQSLFETGKGSLLSDDRKIVKLIERAIVIAQLPIDTNLRPKQSHLTSTSEPSNPAPDRLPNGELSELGRYQMGKGLARCKPDITYIGDYMRRMPDTKESEIMVYLLLWLSDFLSDRFGLDKQKPGYRVNLRWLADYRHGLVVILVTVTATVMKLLFFNQNVH